MSLVLDSGAVTFFAEGSARANVLQRHLADYWPPIVPAVVLVECLQANARDVKVNRFLKTCLVDQVVTYALARDAAFLRCHAGCGSAVDALVVAYAQDGLVVTGDRHDLSALAAHAHDVTIVAI